MAKTLYSLMLDEAVVREVDALAHRLGTNRSNLINTILAEYVDFTTPEQRIQNVLSAIDRLMQPSRDLIPFFAPNAKSVSLKSALDYKYRPTVKYEVTLCQGGEPVFGMLSVLFRTRSAELLSEMTAFFRFWVRMEDALLPANDDGRPAAALDDGKFSRPLRKPSVPFEAEALAGAITEYVKLFDKCLKAFLAGQAGAPELTAAYRRYLADNTLLL